MSASVWEVINSETGNTLGWFDSALDAFSFVKGIPGRFEIVPFDEDGLVGEQ